MQIHSIFYQQSPVLDKYLLVTSVMALAESCKHEEILEWLEECWEKTANVRMNPTKTAVRYWHDQWRLLNLRPQPELD
jgi:hypothetical protein